MDGRNSEVPQLSWHAVVSYQNSQPFGAIAIHICRWKQQSWGREVNDGMPLVYCKGTLVFLQSRT